MQNLFYNKNIAKVKDGQTRRNSVDINKMTERLQTAIINAQSLATANNHQEVDEVHLFLVLIDDEDSLNSDI